jgi:hypothetical protein
MHQLFPNLSPLIADLIGAISIMVGSVLFVGAFVLPRDQAKREIPRTTNAMVLPSLRSERIPPRYQAKKFALKTLDDSLTDLEALTNRRRE